jgi:hypothetical protein
MKYLTLAGIVLLWSSLLRLGAQDTIAVMHYNVLNYGNTTTYCTQTNNNITTKAAAIGLICGYAKPDILTVNEMGANSFAPTHFLNNVLNINGINYYQSTFLTNLSGGDLANFLFFDARKFVFHSQYAIPTDVRDINVYHLYHNDPNLSVHQDTAFLVVITTHLKASNTAADAAARAATTKMLMDSALLWKDFPTILTGDLNLYTASEQAWINLTAPTDTTIERFHDPINMSGAWQNSPLFAAIHTQSTHASSNGCASGGGLDDRFDFILMNEKLKYHSPFYAYVPGSYQSIGNDGSHLNQSINSGTNNSAPANVIQALYDASDHLPVVMKLALTPSTQGIAAYHKHTFKHITCYNGILFLNFDIPVALQQVTLYDLSGRVTAQWQPASEMVKSFQMDAGHEVPTGFYVVQATTREGMKFTGKVIIR